MRALFRGLAVVVLSSFAFACSAQEQSAAYTLGKEYKEVRNVQTPRDPKRVLVEEFFWYGCPHCYAFDPTVSAWEHSRPADVDFERVPSTLGRQIGVVHAKAYYTAEALNVLDKIHVPLFRAIQESRRPMSSEGELAQLFNSVTGVLPDVFSSTFKSFSVDSRQRKSEQLARDYGVTGVPTIVVGGKYVTSPSTAGGFNETVDVVNFLIEKVRKERASP